MEEWGALVDTVKDACGVDYSALTSALANEKDSYHLQSAIEDILGGGLGGGDGSDGSEGGFE
eukprot:1127675-Prorocentrum_minimum.AAC.4